MQWKPADRMTTASTLARVTVSAAAMVILLGAGLFKLGDLPAFGDALRTWQFLPRRSMPFVAVIVPSAELVVSLCWLLGIGRRLALRFAFGLVVAFTIAFVGHWMLLEAPRCGCLGMLMNYHQELDDARFVLGRNLALIAGLAAGIGLKDKATIARVVVPEEACTSVPTIGGRPHGGFTLIELVLVIALVGILVSLMVPSLGRVRESAKVAVSLANLRTHATAATMYAGDFNDQAPYATSPTAQFSVLRCPSRKIATPARYFDMMLFWSIPLADGYYDGNPWSKTFLSPVNPWATGNTAKLGLASNYWYSCAFLASPEYYNYYTRMAPSSQFRSVRLSEVSFTAAKTFHVDAASMFLKSIESPGRRLAGFVDAHAAWGTPSEELTFHDGDGFDTVFTQGGHFPGDSTTAPLLHTQDGVRGRDVK